MSWLALGATSSPAQAYAECLARKSAFGRAWWQPGSSSQGDPCVRPFVDPQLLREYLKPSLYFLLVTSGADMSQLTDPSDLSDRTIDNVIAAWSQDQEYVAEGYGVKISRQQFSPVFNQSFRMALNAAKAATLETAAYKATLAPSVSIPPRATFPVANGLDANTNVLWAAVSKLAASPATSQVAQSAAFELSRLNRAASSLTNFDVPRAKSELGYGQGSLYSSDVFDQLDASLISVPGSSSLLENLDRGFTNWITSTEKSMASKEAPAAGPVDTPGSFWEWITKAAETSPPPAAPVPAPAQPAREAPTPAPVATGAPFVVRGPAPVRTGTAPVVRGPLPAPSPASPARDPFADAILRMAARRQAQQGWSTGAVAGVVLGSIFGAVVLTRTIKRRR